MSDMPLFETLADLEIKALKEKLIEKNERIADLESKNLSLECHNETLQEDLEVHGKAINEIDAAFVSWGMAFYIKRPKESMEDFKAFEHQIARDPRVCKEAAIFALEQQSDGVVNSTNKALQKLTPSGEIRNNYFEEGMFALAYAINEESKKLIQQAKRLKEQVNE